MKYNLIRLISYGKIVYNKNVVTFLLKNTYLSILLMRVNTNEEIMEKRSGGNYIIAHFALWLIVFYILLLDMMWMVDENFCFTFIWKEFSCSLKVFYSQMKYRSHIILLIGFYKVTNILCWASSEIASLKMIPLLVFILATRCVYGNDDLGQKGKLTPKP